MFGYTQKEFEFDCCGLLQGLHLYRVCEQLHQPLCGYRHLLRSGLHGQAAGRQHRRRR